VPKYFSIESKELNSFYNVYDLIEVCLKCFGRNFSNYKIDMFMAQSHKRLQAVIYNDLQVCVVMHRILHGITHIMV
jgi:hypothetical protein